MPESYAAHLFASDDEKLWKAALEAYPSVVSGQGVNDLAELDRWYREDLPRSIANRAPPSLTRDEMIDVVRWKMKRGEWRARNLALVQSNAEDEFRERSIAAFDPEAAPRRALAALSELAGVGPATASAALAAHRPDEHAFLDELVGSAIPDLGPPKFTAGYYHRYVEALKERAARLGRGWTAQSVSLALWAAAGGKAGLSLSD